MKVAVVGVTGVVGTVMLSLLDKRKFPITQIIPVASEKSVGNQIRFQGKDYTILRFFQQEVQSQRNGHPNLQI